MPETPDKQSSQSGMQDLAENYAAGELSPVEGQPESYGPNPTLIPKKYQDIFRDLCRKVSMRDQFARIEEVKNAAMGRFYWRGMFDVCWNESSSIWEQPNLGSGGSYFGRGEQDSGDVSLHYPINIYQQYGRGHISIVSEPWKIRMEATNTTSPGALRISGAADAMREKIEAQNDMKRLRTDASRLSWTDGRTSLYSRYVTDGARFGYEDEAHDDESGEGIGKGEEPPQKKPRIPKGGAVIDAYGVLECKVPINMRDSTQFMFRQLAFEIDITSAKAMYPWAAKKIQGGEPGPGEYNFDRTTRIATTQGIRLLTQTGDTVEQLPTWQRTWFRPAFFAEVDNEDDRQWFESNYPDGALVEFVGNAYCCSRNESMDDHWRDVHPLPGDGQATPACGYILMPVQDALLDLTDLKMERAMKSIPAIYCDKTAVNLQAISKEKAGPGAHYPIMLNGPTDIAANKFFVEPTPQVPLDEGEMWQMLSSEIPQSLTGLYAASMGESDPNNATLGGIKLLTAASKGQSGVTWSAFREAYARSMSQLVKIEAYFKAAEAEDGIIKLNDVDVDLEDLNDGNWACKPDGDESYPNTHAERKEALTEVLALVPTNPQFAALFQSPKNLAIAKDLIGLQDLEISAAATEEKELGFVKRLLQETPIPGPAFMQYQQALQVAAMTGQPAPPQPPDEALYEPSIPIDPKVDNSQFAYQALKDWLNSAAGTQAQMDNEEGYKNVRLRMIAFETQMQKDQQAQMQQQAQLFLLQEQAKHPPKAPKDPSESISINYKDLGASGKIQAAAKVGIDVTADEAAGLAADHMQQGAPPPMPPKPNGKSVANVQ